MFQEIQDRPIATPVKLKPTPLSAARMSKWLETQSGPYDPNQPLDCPLHRWLLSLGFDHDAAYHLAFWMGEARDFDFLFERPWTYEAALRRHCHT